MKDGMKPKFIEPLASLRLRSSVVPIPKTAESHFRRSLAYRPPTKREVVRTACRHESCPAVAPPRQDEVKRVNLLAPIFGWFTEGFDIPDLTEAKALLEELQ